MNQIMKFPEIKKDIVESDYKTACLKDKHGNLLIPWNSRSTKLDLRLSEIEKRLKSAAMKPGVYQVHASTWDKTSTPAVFYVGVGTENQQLEDIEIQTELSPAKMKKVPLSENGFISFDKYQEIYLENLELQATVSRLGAEIDLLNIEIENLNAELDEEPEEGGGLADRNTQFFQNMVETAVPLIDKILQQQDEKIKLRTIELNHLVNGSGTASQKSPGQKFAPVNDKTTPPKNDEEEEPELTEQEEYELQLLENMRVNYPEVYAEMMEKLEAHNTEE